MATIDLNADVGEGEADDEALLALVSSCNIACGGHAGDATTLRRTMTTALRLGVAVGAHPSYPDREGFGRRSGFAAGPALAAALATQLRLFGEIAADLAAVITHVKLHGALYHDAAGDPVLAGEVARLVTQMPGRVALVGPAPSALETAAEAAGIRYVAEGFIDRRYRDDGKLVPRGEPGAVLRTTVDAVGQALSLVRSGTVQSGSGRYIPVQAETLCVHGDSPGAVRMARAVRDALERAGIRVAAPVS